jgi:hypothetical protein
VRKTRTPAQKVAGRRSDENCAATLAMFYRITFDVAMIRLKRRERFALLIAPKLARKTCANGVVAVSAVKPP